MSGINFGTFQSRPTPYDANLRAHYDASRIGPTLVNNDPIDFVQDLSGNSNHLTSSGANRPLFKTEVQNGLPGIDFNSGLTHVLTNTPTGFKTSSLYAAVVITATGVIFKISTASNYANLITAANALSGEAPLTINTKTGHASYPGTPGFPCVVEKYMSTATGNVAVLNGVAGTAISMATGYDLISPTLYVGNNDLGTSNVKGSICELLIYSRIPSVSERLIIRNYLNAKWTVY